MVVLGQLLSFGLALAPVGVGNDNRIKLTGSGWHHMRRHRQRLCAQSMLNKRGRCCSFFLLQSVFNASWLPGVGRPDEAAMVAHTWLGVRDP